MKADQLIVIWKANIPSQLLRSQTRDRAKGKSLRVNACPITHPDSRADSEINLFKPLITMGKKKTVDKASAKAAKKEKTAAKSDRSQKKKSKSKNQADSDSEGEDLESILDKVHFTLHLNAQSRSNFYW